MQSNTLYSLWVVGPVIAGGERVGPVIERSLVRNPDERHYHQLLRWCQYNVTSRP
jgi:hypothetical protein